MEEVIVSPLLEAVIDKLGSDLWKELKLHRGVREDIEKLQSTLSTIKDALEDAEPKSISNKPLHNWLNRLKDAAYDADHVMDEIQIEALRRRMENLGNPLKLKGQVRDFFSSHNHIAFRHRIALKIKDLLERLDAIAEERRNYHLTRGSVSVRIRHEETHSVVTASEVYGRDEDKDMILNFLLNEKNDEDLSVLAIIGIGGVGKTTLAQLVYNDERIKSSFDLRGWVCVSVDFDVRVITRKIIQSINKEVKCDNLELDPLGQLLRETLGRQRFILVLDNVWNGQWWESLKSLLRWGNKGSKILVTTRSEDVARVTDNVLSHKLKGLSADDCWNLFREKAFGLGGQKESPVLIEIGKKIVNKCGGLPLAVKALGSLMGTIREAHEWLAIQNSDIWILNEENEILQALTLSYYHLPAYLKQCFAYCSRLPKDYVFEKEELISLWIGEGFVQSSNEGNKYFNSLSRRSFFDQFALDKYKMHDIMHCLACSVAKDEFRRNSFGGGGIAGGSAGGSGGSGGRKGGRGEGGDSGSNGNYKDSPDQPGGYNNNGSLFFNLMEYNNWRLNARRVKILLLSSLLLEFLRKRSISPMENYLRGCGSETHQNTDLKIQVRGGPVNE